MKNIFGWIIGIVIVWFIFSSFNSYDYPDKDIESDQSDEDIDISDDSLEFNGK